MVLQQIRQTFLMLLCVCPGLQTATAQDDAPVVDTVHTGAVRTYTANGTLGSEFVWDIDQGATKLTVPANNKAQITWGNKPGLFRIAVTERNLIGCWGTPFYFSVLVQQAHCQTEIYAAEQVLTKGDSTQLWVDEQAGYYCRWQGQGLGPLSQSCISVSPTRSQTYTVYLVSDTGSDTCTATKHIEVNEPVGSTACTEPYIYVPNIFTPTDSYNNIFYVRGAPITNMQLEVYNRWGNLVFSATDPTVGWDGYYKGQLADPGVYIYQLQANCANGESFSKKGNVTLVK